MAERVKEYRIDKDVNKERYLKYFPAAEVPEDQGEKKEEPETSEKKCMYCGNIDVPQHNQELFEVCGECRAQLLGSSQEFEDVLWQTRRSLEWLMAISVDWNMEVVYKRNWLQQQKRYFAKPKEEGRGFGRDFVGVQKTKKAMAFIVYERMPRPFFMYLTAGYMFEFFLEKKMSRLSGIEAYRAMKNATMKWCALHYMYLNGYVNFCKWKHQEEVKDSEYEELEKEMSTSCKSSRTDISEVIGILERKIAEMNGKEQQEEHKKEMLPGVPK